MDYDRIIRKSKFSVRGIEQGPSSKIGPVDRLSRQIRERMRLLRRFEPAELFQIARRTDNHYAFRRKPAVDAAGFFRIDDPQAQVAAIQRTMNADRHQLEL